MGKVLPCIRGYHTGGLCFYIEVCEVNNNKKLHIYSILALHTPYHIPAPANVCYTEYNGGCYMWYSTFQNRGRDTGVPARSAVVSYNRRGARGGRVVAGTGRKCRHGLPG